MPFAVQSAVLRGTVSSALRYSQLYLVAQSPVRRGTVSCAWRYSKLYVAVQSAVSRGTISCTSRNNQLYFAVQSAVLRGTLSCTARSMGLQQQTFGEIIEPFALQSVRPACMTFAESSRDIFLPKESTTAISTEYGTGSHRCAQVKIS